MTEKKTLYQTTESGGMRFVSERRVGDVRVPNYIYDIWMPLLGAQTIGVYAVYCRLERQDVVKAMSLSRIAKMCRIGTKTLDKINTSLEECGFIKIKKPQGQARLMHWTTEIAILDPPKEATACQIEKYAPPSGYDILCPWLENKDQPEKLANPSGEVSQQSPEGLANPPKVVSPVLQPLEVEGGDALSPLQEEQGIYTYTMVDETDAQFNCPKCDETIKVYDLPTSRNVCPHCEKVGIRVRDWKGGVLKKPRIPPQTMGVLFGDCPDPFISWRIPPRYRSPIESAHEFSPPTLWRALEWSAGKVREGMPMRQAVPSAIGCFAKMKEEEVVKNPPKPEPVIDHTLDPADWEGYSLEYKPNKAHQQAIRAFRKTTQ